MSADPFSAEKLAARFRDQGGAPLKVPRLSDLFITDALEDLADSKRTHVAVQMLCLTTQYARGNAVAVLESSLGDLPSRALDAISRSSQYSQEARGVAKDELERRLLAISDVTESGSMSLP